MCYCIQCPFSSGPGISLLEFESLKLQTRIDTSVPSSDL